MSSIIRALTIKVGADLTEAQAGLKRLASDLRKAGQDFTTVGTSLTQNITGPVMIGVAALGGLVSKTLVVADQMQTLSDVTGLATTRLQELAFIGARIDVPLDTITGAQSKLIRAMRQAKDGTKAQTDVFKKLGVEAVDPLTGKLRDSNIVFGEAITALGNMKDPTERDAAALVLFGKSALDLNPLIKTSAGELANLTDEAHASGAVLSGQAIEDMDKFKDRIESTGIAISAGASNITLALLPSLENLLDSVVNKGLPALQNFTDKVKGFIDGFNGLPSILKDWTGLLVGTAVLMGPALIGIGKLIGVAKLVVGNFVAMNTAIVGEKGVMASLTALAGGPAGLAVVALATLALVIGGVTILYKEAYKEALALRDEAKTLTTECNNSAKAFSDQNTEIENNTILATRLAGELFNLNDKENKSNIEKSRMAMLVAQLNEMYPDLNLTISAETGLLNKSRDAVVTLVKEKEKSLKFAAYEARMVEQMKESIKLEEQKADALKAVTDKYGPMTDAQVRDSVAAGHAYGGTIPMLIQAYMDIAGALDTNNAAYATTAAAYDKMATDIASGTDTLVADTADADAETIAAQEAAATAYQSYRDGLETTTQEYMDAMGGFYADGIELNKTSADQIQANLLKQTEQFTTWLAEIKKIGQKVPPALLQELIDMGPEATIAIEDLNNMSDTELAAWVQTWKDNAKAANDAAVYELGQTPGTISGLVDDMNTELQNTDPLYQSSVQMGKTISQGLAAGITADKSLAVNAAGEVAEAIKEKLKTHIKPGSPSKVTTVYGKSISDGLGLGIKIRAMDAISQAKNLAASVMGAFQNMGSFACPQLAYAAAASAPQSSSARSESNAASMYQAVTKAFQDSNQNRRIEVPVYLNGREIARASANDMDAELAKIKTNKIRGG